MQSDNREFWRDAGGVSHPVTVVTESVTLTPDQQVVHFTLNDTTAIVVTLPPVSECGNSKFYFLVKTAGTAGATIDVSADDLKAAGDAIIAADDAFLLADDHVILASWAGRIWTVVKDGIA